MLTAIEHVRLMRKNDPAQVFLLDTLMFRVYNEKRLEKISLTKQDIVLVVSLVSEYLKNDPNFPVYIRKIGLCKYPDGTDESIVYASELLHDHIKGAEEPSAQHESEDLWLLYENSLERNTISEDGSLLLDVGSNENLYMLLLLMMMVRQKYGRSASNEHKFLAGIASRLHQTSMRLIEPGKGFVASRFLSLWNARVDESYVRSYRVETEGMLDAPWFFFADFPAGDKLLRGGGASYVLPPLGSYGNRHLVYRTDDRRHGDTVLAYRKFSIESGGTFKFANYSFSLDEERVTVTFSVLDAHSVAILAVAHRKAPATLDEILLQHKNKSKAIETSESADLCHGRERGALDGKLRMEERVHEQFEHTSTTYSGEWSWYAFATDGKSWLRCKFSRPPKTVERIESAESFKSDLPLTNSFRIADNVARILEPKNNFVVFSASAENALRVANKARFDVITAAEKPLLAFNGDSVLQTYDEPLLQFYKGVQFVQEPQNRLLIYGRSGKKKLVS